jgi:abortive infection bacteriophage resistance protein
MKPAFSKAALIYADQITLLKSRGMIIFDEAKAEHLLAHISYYRLSGYWYPLLEIPKENHQFKQNASFEAAFQLYCFDRDLRKLVMAELEKIEIAVRAKMIYHLSHTAHPIWYSDGSLFSDTNSHQQTLAKITQEYRRSDEEFVKAFKLKYSDTHPPSWLMMEVVSFGTMSHLYKNLKNSRHRRVIAHEFGLDDNTFESWLHALVYIRNVCAHHTRLWNRELRISPRIPRNPANVWLSQNSLTMTTQSRSTSPNNRMFFLLSMLIYFTTTISPSSKFAHKFQALLAKFPTVDLVAMGFPNDWAMERIWQ